MPVRTLAALTAVLCCLAAPAAAGAAVPGAETSYVVTLRDGDATAPAHAADRARRHGAAVTAVYDAALRGFAGRLSPEALAAVRADPAVAAVEPDGTSRMAATQTPAPSER